MNANEYPLVSVLILFYNQEKFVEETLNSVLAQDYPYVEIITADDASTDGTVAVIKRYAAAHSNIKPVLSTVNGGITKNCNNALQEATGKYLVFLGGDDLMLPGRITSQVQYFLQHPDISVCCTDIQIFYDGQPHKNFVYRNREFYKKMSPARIIAQDNAPPTAGSFWPTAREGNPVGLDAAARDRECTVEALSATTGTVAVAISPPPACRRPPRPGPTASRGTAARS